jgi:hypothetical protein
MLTGCGTTTAEKTATTALGQLTTYQRDVNGKVRAESDYYEKVAGNAAMRIKELWDNEQPFRLEQAVRAFSTENAGTPADQLASRLLRFFDEATKAWAERDEGYEQLLAETAKVLADRRKALEMDKARITQLKNKLQTLSVARSDREMLNLAIGFVRETKDRLDEAQAAAPAAPR